MSTLSVANLSDLSGGTNINIGGGTPEKLVLMTAQATTSGTSIDFTGIPSWVKRITVMFNGVSTSGSSNKLIQIGSGSIQNSGYVSTSAVAGGTNSTGVATSTAGFLISSGNAAAIDTGLIQIILLGSNIWVCSGVTQSGTLYNTFTTGNVTLSGTLDRVRYTTVNGTDTFDAGSVNILYEG